MITEDPNDPERDYIVVVGDPYLTTDMAGKYVVLQDEQMFSAPSGEGVDKVYETEALVDPNPSEEEIFRLKLKGATKPHRLYARAYKG